MITKFPNIFDSSNSSLLEYRSIFKKYMVDNNRNFLLSFLKRVGIIFTILHNIYYKTKVV